MSIKPANLELILQPVVMYILFFFQIVKIVIKIHIFALIWCIHALYKIVMYKENEIKIKRCIDKSYINVLQIYYIVNLEFRVLDLETN
jgi:fatty acid desaturase